MKLTKKVTQVHKKGKISCSTSDTCHVAPLVTPVMLLLFKNLVTRHERGKEDRIVTMTNGT